LSESVAWANGDSQIACADGAQGPLCATDPDRWNWDVPTVQATAGTSNSKVFVEGKLVAVEGDAMAAHPDGVPCVPSPAQLRL